MIKASEIFMEYCAPLREGMPSAVTIEFLKETYMLPELVWNAVVLEKNLNRKPGELPELLHSIVQTNFPHPQRKEGELMLTFWVHRKDTLFSEHRWPLVTEIYENIKKEIIVRVQVHDNKNHKISIPSEWSNKKAAPIIPLGKR